MHRCTAVWILSIALLGCRQPEVYEVVIASGRVMDPASGLDATRNVGVIGDRIAKISEEELEGEVVLEAANRVVAPGFIDLHEHGQSAENYRAQIEDGVTTALELEIGVEDIAAFYDERKGAAAVNYGASISHPYSRNLAMTGENPGLTGDAALEPIHPEQQEELLTLLEKGLEQGAAAVGFGIAYTPGMNQDELDAAFAVAAKHRATAHVHMRTDHETFANLDEVVSAAEKTGASLHIVHINSSGRDRALQYLERIAEAQERGIDVTTECYPYNRGSTFLESHQFDDWEGYSDEYIAGFTWVATGEALTRETFGPYRERGGLIISPPTYSLETVKSLVAHPMPMIASDGMWIVEGKAHPRSYGTYSRVLGRYVREEGVLTLMDALRKMTLRPAQRMEKRVPSMANKGRLQEGMDADIVVFDPETILDKGTYEDPAKPSAGIAHVLVNGVVSLRSGRFVEGASAGRAVRAPR